MLSAESTTPLAAAQAPFDGADGTVNTSSDRRGFFGRGGLDAVPLQPGDALVVPNQLDFETWGRAFVRNLKDFAQIISGFGIGIAAIHSINN